MSLTQRTVAIIVGAVMVVTTLASMATAVELPTGDEIVTETSSASQDPDVEDVRRWKAEPFTARDGRQLSYDVYVPEPREPRPLVVYLHGGAWSGGSAASREAEAEFLAWQGYTVLNVDYRLTSDPDAPTHPELVTDVVDAMNTFAAVVRAVGGADLSRTAIMGDSAGGHLAALLGLGPWRGELDPDYGLRGIASVSGVYDLPSAFATWPTAAPAGVVGPLAIAHLAGCPVVVEPIPSWRPTPDCARAMIDASPITHVSADDPALFLVHDVTDPVVPYEQHQEMSTAARELGVPVTPVTVLAKGSHGQTTFPYALLPLSTWLDDTL